MVGPMWSRVVLTLGSDYILALSQRTCLVMWCLGHHMLCYLIHSHWLCVMCPFILPLPAYLIVLCSWGCTSTSYCLVLCVCVVMCASTPWYLISHDGLYLYRLLCYQHGLGLLMLPS